MSARVVTVKQAGRDWQLELPGGRTISLYLSEFPGEVGSIRGRKAMLRALYDLWNTSDDLEHEDKGDGLLFVTPFGTFATYSVHVLPIEDAVAMANRTSKAYEKTRSNIEESIKAQMGFGRSDVKKITDRYGFRFDDWPKDVTRAYWNADQAAIDATNRLVAPIK